MTNYDARFRSQDLMVFLSRNHIYFHPILICNAYKLLQYAYLMAWDRACTFQLHMKLRTSCYTYCLKFVVYHKTVSERASNNNRIMACKILHKHAMPHALKERSFIFIAPAYSRVRYRSPNFCPSVRSFVRSSVRSSVNIYVEVWFSRHQ